MRVVLDPGHGGDVEIGGSSPNNASGPNGLLEKSATLDVALMAQLYLGSLGVDCRLTRSTDNNLGLEDRARVARTWPADAFVSIHFNASDDHAAQGVETWQHRQASAGSRSLSAAVQAAAVSATGHRDRGVKTGGYAVTRPDYHHAATGACLVEVSFMDRADEEARLRQAPYKDRIASALAQGIYGWLVAMGRSRLPDFPTLKMGAEPPPRKPQDGYETLNGVGSDDSCKAESCRERGNFLACEAPPASEAWLAWTEPLTASDLTVGQKVPAASEVATCGAITGKIRRGTPAFDALVANTNPDIVFKNEEGDAEGQIDDQMMSQRLKDKLDALAVLVKREWSGVKLRVTEAWDENDEHAGTSLHYEGRGADITTSPLDGTKLGRLGRLAVDVGCDWVYYEDASHVHVSVKR